MSGNGILKARCIGRRSGAWRPPAGGLGSVVYMGRLA